MTHQHPIVVVAAIIEKEGRYLITQRPSNKHNGDRWEFPGGKINFGEDPRLCLKREIKEELGIDISVHDIVDVTSQMYGEKHIILLGFKCKFLSGKISKLDIQAYEWITKLDFPNYDMTEADLPFLGKL